jgi:entericidin B
MRWYWHAACSDFLRVDRITPIRQIEGTAMLKKLIFCFAALAAVSLTACNTIQGAGKDVERGGQKVQEEAKEVKQKL